MAKKFIRVNGLHNIFDSENDRYDTQVLSESVDSSVINEYSICFITADDTDSSLNSIYNGTYIWAHGVLFPCKDTENKQDKLTAGESISIDSANTINVANWFLPIGSITMWATATPPTGWLICNGQSITADTYTALRTVLGTSVVPDLTGRFPLGANATHALGSSGGTEEETLTINEMPSHSHTVSKGYHYGGSSEIGGTVNLNTYNLNSRTVRQATADELTPEDFNPVNYVDLNGGGQPHNNMPPYFTLNFIIKYK